MDQRVKGLPQHGRASGGRLDDEVLVVTIEKAGTASRPARVQACEPHLVELVDHVADGVLVSLDHAGYDEDRAAAG